MCALSVESLKANHFLGFCFGVSWKKKRKDAHTGSQISIWITIIIVIISKEKQRITGFILVTVLYHDKYQ